ncbi:aspartate kinase [Tissierella carlieri]|uniref:aspartate kinase n=1 Tax=Tissierella carlieri TaxID=689904 RepID=UPI001C10FEBE|nr:aspartate kinase [Tissierella carlieri]MBU5311740.1 aspartate kinase [Tissierella carlieri]MDU5080763.1 aspartate kinase [Bacillota bacterium]
MKIIIQKFGGTSVMNDERRNLAIDKIKAAIDKHLNPVVVVSAIGRAGDPYATDTLIQLAKSVGIEPNPRELDILMACGEIISATVMANTLKVRGYEAAVFTGGQAGIITDENFLDAKILHVEPMRILKSLEEGIIPIIAGFQGTTEKGDITTLGRGGSDVTASIMGEALNAELVEIYTDVDGVMTADPKIVPDAKVMDTIFYNEVFQMAEYGAKVLHPKAVEIAMRSNIPIVIRNTSSDYNGTLITNYHRTRSYIEEDTRIITSVANINNRIQVKIIPDKLDYESQEILFDSIAKAGVSIDMINIYPEQIFFIIDEKQSIVLEAVLKELNYEYELITDCTKVTIIGNRMRGIPGVMAKAVSALVKENIEILQTSDSHTTISCLIKSEHTNRAVNALHKYFELGK